MKKQYVSSSTAEALGYDEKKKIFRVWFTTGKIYDYANVPKTEFETLLCIKDSYPYKKVK